MAVIAAGSKILVSGANGFIAVWVVQLLLEAGYAVRGTVRSAAKGEHLKTLFAKYGDKLEVVVVADITAPGAFDDAVKGVDAIEHTASPFHLKADDPDELIKPAVHGTTGILESALKHGQTVKRIVITSSVASVLNPSAPKGTVYTEKDWNLGAIAQVKEKGREASNLAKYQASKSLAERAAWDFLEKHKGEVAWDMVALNPPLVFGPLLHEPQHKEALNTSAYLFLTNVAAGETPEDTLLNAGGSWVDVRDVAAAHVLALQKPQAAGERFLISADGFVWQEWVDIANGIAPSLGITGLQKGKPDGVKGVPPARFDHTKSVEVLGVVYHSRTETATDMLKDFKERGYLKV